MATAYGIRTYGAPATGPARAPLAVGDRVYVARSRSGNVGSVVAVNADGRLQVAWDAGLPAAYHPKFLRRA